MAAPMISAPALPAWMTAPTKVRPERPIGSQITQNSALHTFGTFRELALSQKTLLDDAAVLLDLDNPPDFLNDMEQIGQNSEDDSEDMANKGPVKFTTSVQKSYRDEMRDVLLSAEAMQSGILSARVYGQHPEDDFVPEQPPKRQKTSSKTRSKLTHSVARPLCGELDIQIPILIDEESNEFAPSVPVPEPAPAPAPAPTPGNRNSTEAPATRTQSSTERRRSQMRQAQRNYRLRREATISALEQRNQVLEKVVDGMASAFMALQETAMKSSLSKEPEVARRLRVSTEDFIKWARIAQGSESGDENPQSEDEDDENEVETRQERTEGKNSSNKIDMGIIMFRETRHDSNDLGSSMCKLWDVPIEWDGRKRS